MDKIGGLRRDRAGRVQWLSRHSRKARVRVKNKKRLDRWWVEFKKKIGV